jgi:hypothetical protein
MTRFQPNRDESVFVAGDRLRGGQRPGPDVAGRSGVDGADGCMDHVLFRTLRRCKRARSILAVTSVRPLVRALMRLAFRSCLRALRRARFTLASIMTTKTIQRNAVKNTNMIDSKGCMRRL